MKRFLQMLFTGILICGSTVGGSSPAYAGAQDQSTVELYEKLTEIKSSEGEAAADAYFNTLSPHEQEAIGDFISQSTITEESSSGIVPAASGCWSRTHTVESKSAYWPHELFWRLSQNIYWCGDGTWITYLNCSATISSPGFGWGGEFITYCGVVYGGQGYNAYKYFSQANFWACWSSNCPINSQPIVYQQGNGGGGYAGWRG